MHAHAGMPEEARPQTARRGRLSYTLTSPHTGGKVEVLLKLHAFRLAKVGEQGGRSASFLFVVFRFVSFCRLFADIVRMHSGVPIHPRPAVVQNRWGDDIAAAWLVAKEIAAWDLPPSAHGGA